MCSSKYQLTFAKNQKMKIKNSLTQLALTLLIISSCSEHITDTLAPNEFAKEIQQDSSSIILLDLRSPQEFSVSRIDGAKNIDINGNFENDIKTLDKNKTVYVYCLSGSKTNEASKILSKNGYKVKALQQGIMGWKTQGLPIKNTDPLTGQKRLSVTENLNELMKGDKLVMVDFYADWCRPCKMMEPFVNQVKQERKEDVIVLKINTDEEPELSQKYNISSIPTLILFKNDQIQYNNAGFHDYDQLNDLVNKYK